MSYILSPGHRVTWVHDFTETKAQITRVWKNKAEILTTDFQKIKVPLDELELVPVVKAVVRDKESCTLTDSFLDEGKNGCTLTPLNERSILSLNDTRLSPLIDEPKTSITPRVIENPQTSITPRVIENPKTSITPRVIENPQTSITPRVIENPSGTIGQYRKGENFYWRYSYRRGRHKSVHKHIGKVGCKKADCLADEIKALIDENWPIEEILRML